MQQEKINREIRKRHYTYTLLDYILSNSTYFDFFSLDTFQVLMHSKYVGSICLSSEKVIGSEFFLFSFLTLELPIKKLLLGQPIDKVLNKDAMANPHCLPWYVNFAQKRAT